MASTSLFESFLSSQGYALFESLGAGDFSVVGDCPAWCRDIFAIHSVPGKPVHLDERSPFLENFLVDAEEFWNSKSEGSANSGNWIERDKHGREVPLEAFALSLLTARTSSFCETSPPTSSSSSNGSKRPEIPSSRMSGF